MLMEELSEIYEPIQNAEPFAVNKTAEQVVIAMNY
jgi:hypothetical protein